MKPWYESKVIWFNVILTLLDIAALFEVVVPAQAVIFFTLTQGIGNIILRRWFTTQPLE